MTAKQQRFVQEYLIDLNATKAAIRAGYKSKNAECIGSRLVKKCQVAEAINQAVERRAVRLNIKSDRVLEELFKIAYADRAGIARVKNGRVKLTDTDLLTDDQRAAISEVSETQHGISVKLNDKLKALELIGRHLGMFLDKVQHNVNVSNNLTDDQLAAIAAGGGPNPTPPACGPEKPA